MTFTTSSRQVCCLKCSTFKLHMPFHACLYIPTLIKTLSGCYMMRPDTDCALRIYQGQGCVELYGSAHQHASSRLPPHTQPHRHGVMQKETAACLRTMAVAASSKRFIQTITAQNCCTPGTIHCSARKQGQTGRVVPTFLHLAQSRSCSW